MMSLPLANYPEMEALLQRGAVEVTRLNPHIGTPPPQFTFDEIDAMLRDEAEFEALWQTPEGHRVQLSSYTAADAIDEDRGE